MEQETMFLQIFILCSPRFPMQAATDPKHPNKWPGSPPLTSPKIVKGKIKKWKSCSLRRPNKHFENQNLKKNIDMYYCNYF
jgi:hypothetical protein